MIFIPFVSVGTEKATAYSLSSSVIDIVGITSTSWEFTIPVWCTFAPLTTIPSFLFSTIWRNKSGSSCFDGESPLSPLGSVIAPSTVKSSFCTYSRNFLNLAWYSVPYFWSVS